jgi:hypothetical protein
VPYEFLHRIFRKARGFIGQFLERCHDFVEYSHGLFTIAISPYGVAAVR